MGTGTWIGGALVGLSAAALVAVWVVAPGDDSGDALTNEAVDDPRRVANESRVREHTAPASVGAGTDHHSAARPESASESITPDDEAIAVDGLDAAEIERSIALLETIDIGGVPGAEAWREMIELVRSHDGDRRVFIELALELERTEQMKFAGLLLSALGNVVDEALTLRLLESVDRLQTPILRRIAILSLAQDRHEIGPPPGDRKHWIDGADWVALASGVHEAEVRQRLIVKTRTWIASENAEDEALWTAAIEVLRFSVTYPDARNTLIEAIDAPREGVGTSAVMALIHHTPERDVRDALRGAITTEANVADHARSHAVGALVRLGGDEGVEWVLTQIETTESPSPHLLSALGSLSSYRTSPALIRRAKDALLRCLDARDPEVQELAATALIWKTDPGGPLAADSDEILALVVAFIRNHTRDETARWRVMGQMGTRPEALELGFDAFVEMARDESATERLRKEALDRIGQLASSENPLAAAAEEVLRTYPETTRVERLRRHARGQLAEIARSRK